MIINTRIYLLGFLLFLCNCLIAQKNDSFVFSGLVESYYCWDFENPSNHEMPFFFFNHKRHNEVNINLAYVKSSYYSNNIRGNFGLMVGNYAQYNLASEPDLYRNLFEANIGIKLPVKPKIWIDAGVMPSHIGFESAISMDCWVLSRSLLAENSPFYETGIKTTYTSKNELLNISLMYLNGWQKIVRSAGYNQPCWGTQINYKSPGGHTFNHSTFLGADLPDSAKSYRVYNNLFYIRDKPGKIGWIMGFDYGLERSTTLKWIPWFSPVIICRKQYRDGNSVAARIEYYNDPSPIVIPVHTPDGFKVIGISTNYDLKLGKECFWRNEIKWFYSEDAIFNNNSQRNNFTILSSLTLRLTK